ncbi:MAG TPA: hypothetical protein VFV34_20005 [Blastocatellia bacterium]|nr:hypothetical protein [Blastocatellia bacterium]
MKRLSLAISVLALVGGLVYGSNMASFKGYLVDNMCAAGMKDNAEKAKGHKKSCATSAGCAKSGYALVTDDGKVYKLDEEGSKKAAEVFKNTKSETSPTVSIEGTLDGTTLKVTKLEESM